MCVLFGVMYIKLWAVMILFVTAPFYAYSIDATTELVKIYLKKSEKILFTLGLTYFFFFFFFE